MATTQDDPPLPGNVLGNADEIKGCFFSAQRKIDIASFHFAERRENSAAHLAGCIMLGSVLEVLLILMINLCGDCGAAGAW
jgi:hypothetical protein